jgi:hypothetical protein
VDQRHRRALAGCWAALDDPYADLLDRGLAAMLAHEDAAERGGLSALERLTCRTHRTWTHDCVSSPLHVVVGAGYRWCADCETAAAVLVDQFAGVVEVWCPLCGRDVRTPATRLIVGTCRASILAARRSRQNAAARRRPDAA